VAVSESGRPAEADRRAEDRRLERLRGVGLALATGVAMFCYLVSLFILGRPAQRGPS
jgi:hypothetical protein